MQQSAASQSANARAAEEANARATSSSSSVPSAIPCLPQPWAAFAAWAPPAAAAAAAAAAAGLWPTAASAGQFPFMAPLLPTSAAAAAALTAAAAAAGVSPPAATIELPRQNSIASPKRKREESPTGSARATTPRVCFSSSFLVYFIFFIHEMACCPGCSHVTGWLKALFFKLSYYPPSL